MFKNTKGHTNPMEKVCPDGRLKLVLKTRGAPLNLANKIKKIFSSFRQSKRTIKFTLRLYHFSSILSIKLSEKIDRKRYDF